jgi:hypothetical protein
VPVLKVVLVIEDVPDIEAIAAGEMAMISTPFGVSRVESTIASSPTSRRTCLRASLVVEPMNRCGAVRVI